MRDDDAFDESLEPEGEQPEYEPLPPEEREGVEADLEDLESMRVVFEAQGAKGVVIACTDCGSNHYYGWDLLLESLVHPVLAGVEHVIVALLQQVPPVVVV